METSTPLSRQAIEEFKTIYLAEFHKPISDDEAQAMAESATPKDLEFE